MQSLTKCHNVLVLSLGRDLFYIKGALLFLKDQSSLKMLRAYIFSFILIIVSCQEKPNVIVILADDLGFDDIGYRNPDVLTPNIDELARNGVILDRNYVSKVCTPSRTALLTGMYPYKLGLQV